MGHKFLKLSDALACKVLVFLTAPLFFVGCNKTVHDTVKNEIHHSQEQSQEHSKKNNEAKPIGVKKLKLNNYFVDIPQDQTLKDYLPQGYQIQYQAEGDLNKDKKSDAVLVFKDPLDPTKSRVTLVLLNNGDGSYRLDKKSDTALPPQYIPITDSDPKTDPNASTNYSEELLIEKGMLKINLNGPGGPIGNIYSTFQYTGSELLLKEVETFNAGAGAQQEVKYHLLRGEVTYSVTNTMKDDMPTKTKTFKVTPKRITFEKASPDEDIFSIARAIEPELQKLDWY